MPTVADGVTEVFPANRIAVRSVPVGEFTNSFAIRPFYSGPDASQWGGLEPENRGPSAADRGPPTRGGIYRRVRKRSKDCRKDWFCRRMKELARILGDVARATGQEPGTFVVNASNRVDGPIGTIRGRVLPPRIRAAERIPEFREPRPRARAPARGRLRSQGGYIDPALLGIGPPRRARPRRGARATVSPPRSAQDGPTSNALPRPAPAVRAVPVPSSRPGALPGTLPAPAPRPRTAPQPRPDARPAPQARPTPAGRPDALAKIRKSAAAAAQRAAGVARGRLISKAAGIGTKAAGARKFMSELLKPPRAAPFTLRFSRPQLGRSAQLLRDPFQVQGLTPVQQPQLALQPEPAMPGDRRRIRSSRGTRCPDRKGRKKGLCQQGYFRETPDGITYTKWSERKCQASSRKKPP